MCHLDIFHLPITAVVRNCCCCTISLLDLDSSHIHDALGPQSDTITACDAAASIISSHITIQLKLSITRVVTYSHSSYHQVTNMMFLAKNIQLITCVNPNMIFLLQTANTSTSL